MFSSWLAPGQSAHPAEITLSVDGGPAQLGGIPGHGWLLPLHPSQLVSIRADGWIPHEILRGMKHDGRLIQTVDRHLHEAVPSSLLHHADPAVSHPIDHAAAEQVFPRQGEPPGGPLRLNRLRVSTRESAPGPGPQTAIAVIDPGEQEAVAKKGFRAGTPAVFVDPASQVAGGRGQLLGRLVRASPCPKHGRGAAFLLGPLLEPQQPVADNSGSLQRRLSPECLTGGEGLAFGHGARSDG